MVKVMLILLTRVRLPSVQFFPLMYAVMASKGRRQCKTNVRLQDERNMSQQRLTSEGKNSFISFTYFMFMQLYIT